MKGKARFSKERHEAIGAALEPIRRYLLDLSVELARAYPVQSPVVKAGQKTMSNLDELICRLDEVVYAENPGQLTSKGERLCRIYYPQEVGQSVGRERA